MNKDIPVELWHKSVSRGYVPFESEKLYVQHVFLYSVSLCVSILLQ